MSNIFLFADVATTNIASALSFTATTIAVTTGTGQLFPQPGAGQQFALILNPPSAGSVVEIVYVTAVTGDTFTVLRGQEGTTAQNWNVGDVAFNGSTSGQMAAMQQSANAVTPAQIQAQAGNWATDTGTANTLAVALSPAPASLSALKGVPIRVLKGASANSGAVTLNVNSLGAKAVQIGGQALASGQLPASCFLTVVYDGSSTFDLQSVVLTPSFTGDSGSGGGAGLVPAPPAGSGAKNYLLFANGGWGRPTLTLNVVEFTTPGAFSFNVPSNALPVGFGISTGAGAGSGFCGTGRNGGGGGAGGSAQGPISITPGGTITGSVGAGGSGGTSSVADGGSGGDTTLGALTGSGGSGGAYNATVAGGSGGGASGGSINVQGGWGVDGSTSTNNTPWACGGGSYWGGGIRAGNGGANSGGPPGAGGGSAYGSSGLNGGAGVNGIAVLYYWTY